MATTIKFEFHELIVPKDLQNAAYSAVAAALRSAVETPFNDADGHPLRVETLIQTEDYLYGTATKTAMTDIPYRIRAKVKGAKAKPLDLEEDEGLGKPTAFLISALDGRLVITLQRNWHGFRAGGLLDLLEAITKKPGQFSALPIIEKEKLRQVLSWGEYRKIEARISNPASPDLYESEAAKDVAKMTHAFQARTVSFILSSGRSKKWSLSVDQVRATINDLLRINHEGRRTSKGPAGQLKTLVVTGRNLDRELGEEIDLLKHRLVRTIDVAGDPKTVEISVLEKAVQQAYSNASAALAEHFGV